MTSVLIILLIFNIFRHFFSQPQYQANFRHNHCKSPQTNTKNKVRQQAKPPWVKKEILKLKALLPDMGCRKIADTFNRLHAKQDISVSKTYVNDITRNNLYEIHILRRKIRNRVPTAEPRNRTWGMDLTGKKDSSGSTCNILGIVEHQSRLALTLQVVRNKSSIVLLRHLLDAIEKYGKPKIIRTDNEAIFQSWTFKLILSALNIKHQTSDLACPWQNGRIERLFGTLKEKLNQIKISDAHELSLLMSDFRFWYNHVRTHQYLDGKTPTEVWHGIDVYKKLPHQWCYYRSWDGLLTGFQTA